MFLSTIHFTPIFLPAINLKKFLNGFNEFLNDHYELWNNQNKCHTYIFIVKHFKELATNGYKLL